MKIKTVSLVLALIATAPLIYAADQPIKWLDEPKKPIVNQPTPKLEKPRLPKVEKPKTIEQKKSTLQLPVDEKALVGKSIAEIVAFAEANPDNVMDITFAALMVAKDSEQATLIAQTLIARFPDQAVAIKAALASTVQSSAEYQAAINSKVLYSEAIINPTQDIVNNIQASANQGLISQSLANVLITTIVLRSGGGATAPLTPPSPS